MEAKLEPKIIVPQVLYGSIILAILFIIGIVFSYLGSRVTCYNGGGELTPIGILNYACKQNISFVEYQCFDLCSAYLKDGRNPSLTNNISLPIFNLSKNDGGDFWQK